MSKDERRAYRPMAAQLETERLLLRPFHPDDAQLYSELIAERGPGARGYGSTVEQARDNIVRLNGVFAETGIGFLAIVLKGEGDGRIGDGLIGYCGLLVGRASADEPEIAYELFRRAHGHGYATEAAGAIVGAAAATGRRRLWSTVREWNGPSFRVLEKLGFRRDHVQAEDAGGDVVYLVRELITDC